ncbi:MAG: glutamine--fructose-6-phosphate transaminase (isomerizing) [Actinomycetota bacterium]
MCGIVGYVGKDEALPFLLEGLRRLEYRGYDSAGVAVADQGVLHVVRKAGKLRALEEELGNSSPAGTSGIGHTRWATHGAPSDRNAHPHLDCPGRIAVIHNGILENFAELRERLVATGHHFTSQTDTECLAHLIEEHRRDGESLAEAVRAALGEVEGSFAIGVICVDEPHLIVGAKRSLPLVVGQGVGETFLASDVTAFLGRTKDAIVLEDDQVVELRPSGIRLTDLAGNPSAGHHLRVEWDLAAAEKQGYPTFMLKEIFEQPLAARETMRGRFRSDGSVVLDELRMDASTVKAIDKVFVVAAGTSYHAGLVAKYAIEHWTRVPVEVEMASEFRYRDPVLGSRTLVVAISQSGETADTLAAGRHARQQGAPLLAVTNVVGSTLARQSDAVLYTRAGPEIGVAATKTFTAQMVALYVIGLYLAQVKGSLPCEEIAAAVGDLDEIPGHIEGALSRAGDVRRAAASLAAVKDVLFMGRHVGYPIALEGALKLKEISYIHAEGYPAGEMKHGPIALIEEGTPVVVVATAGHVYSKMLSNIQEVKARGAHVIAVASEGDTRIGELAAEVLWVPSTPELLSPLVAVIPLQILAYEVAMLLGCDVDQPRNLAKSVTVE